MLRTLKATAAAAAFAGIGLLAYDTANAQWGYAPGPTYLHSPYTASSFSFGYTTGSRYSLYGPSYDYAAPSYGYAPAYGYSSFYAPAAPAYGYGAYPGPALGRPHGKLEYDVYGLDGRRQEIEYKFRRNGTVRVDVDD
jgi:hypothetical protein